MSPQQQIQTIESKIVEIKNTLTSWTEQINNHHTTLNKITEQLTNIKKQLN